MKSDLKEYLITNSIPEPNSGCFLWLLSIDPNGYGQISETFGFRKAHRASYFAFKGIDPGKLFVCHTCDNRICINPDHLFLGTAKDNYQDMVNKNRINLKNRGNKTGLKKLTRITVEEIHNSVELHNQGISTPKIIKLLKLQVTKSFLNKVFSGEQCSSITNIARSHKSIR